MLPFRQPSPGMNQYPVIRSAPPPPHRLPGPGPQGMQHMYHSHSMDSSPSGGGLIIRDPNSPSLVPPPIGSPIHSKGNPTPPPYSRTPAQVLSQPSLPAPPVQSGAAPANTTHTSLPNSQVGVSSTLPISKITSPRVSPSPSFSNSSNGVTSVKSTPQLSEQNEQVSSGAVSISIQNASEPVDHAHLQESGATPPIMQGETMPIPISGSVGPPPSMSTIYGPSGPAPATMPGDPPVRPMPMMPPHLQQPRSNLPPYHSNIPPTFYGSYPPNSNIEGNDESLPSAQYQGSPYPEHYSGEGSVASENSNKEFEEESGGEFGGLVSYFSSQREDDLDT